MRITSFHLKSDNLLSLQITYFSMLTLCLVGKYLNSTETVLSIRVCSLKLEKMSMVEAHKMKNQILFVHNPIKR